MAPVVIIAGASARAAAQSASRAGYRVLAADLFGDSDLRKCAAESVRVHDYPNGLLDALDAWPSSDWLYTGGLENEPVLIEAISLLHRLCGTGPTGLLRVRDPWKLHDMLQSDGLLFPVPRRQPDWTQARHWIWKPVKSCGGIRIVLVEPTEGAFAATWPGRGLRDVATMNLGATPVPGPSVAGEACPSHGPTARMETRTGVRSSRNAGYFQPLVAGPSFSAQFVAADSKAHLLGVTRQLVACRWAGARPFWYVGSIGPVRIKSHHLDSVRCIGNCLARQARLSGLFGVDFVINATGVWTLDVNPRFCASIEVLERAYGISAIAIHMAASVENCLPDWPMPASAPLHGKAIVFAPSTLSVGRRFFRRIARLQGCDRFSHVSDIPSPNSRLDRNGPVVTVFARGATIHAVTKQLQARTQSVLNALN